MIAKNHFLYVGWHTHLTRFHGEQPYRARVESKSCCLLGGLVNFVTLESKCVFIHGP